jgi:hypothetical protein
MSAGEKRGTGIEQLTLSSQRFTETASTHALDRVANCEEADAVSSERTKNCSGAPSNDAFTPAMSQLPKPTTTEYSQCNAEQNKMLLAQRQPARGVLDRPLVLTRQQACRLPETQVCAQCSPKTVQYSGQLQRKKV